MDRANPGVDVDRGGEEYRECGWQIDVSRALAVFPAGLCQRGHAAGR
jgi:hypothetical protein